MERLSRKQECIGILEVLCGLLSKERAEYYDESAIIYRDHPYFNSKSRYPLHFYVKSFKDICWKIALKKIESCCPALELEDLDISKIRPRNYFLRQDPLKRFYLYKEEKIKPLYKNKKPPKIEKDRYENIRRVRGIPIIIESTLGGAYNMDFKRCTLNKFLRQHSYSLIITPKGHANGKNFDFSSDKDIILRWNISREEFEDNVKSTLKKYGLEFTESIEMQINIGSK